MGEFLYRLDILGGVDLDVGAHGGSDGAGTDILALGSCGLSLHNSANRTDISLYMSHEPIKVTWYVE